MADDPDDLYSDGDHDDQWAGMDFSRDDTSELGPEDSASQIGRAITTNEETYTEPRVARPYSPPSRSPQMNGTHSHSYNQSFSRPDVAGPMPLTPPSRRTSARSSRILTPPTTFMQSKTDRLRYSWQSLHGDEPNRPRIHVIKIVSTTATASAGSPQGEALGFAVSPLGRRIAAYNSARLFVLQTAALPVNVSQEYALRRRPLAIDLIDDGNILAVLSDEHTIYVYDLSHHRVKRLKSLKPDFSTHAIALSSTGGLIAAAYEGGVEVFSLDSSALSTDRRAIRCSKMDRLVFSEDGSTLLGTTTRINASSTVVVSVPVFPSAPNGVASHEELKEAWCTTLLSPENILNSSHATFTRENNATNTEKLFAWNASEDTFGILSTSDMEYNNVDFPVTISPPLSTCGGLGAAIHSPPAVDEHGDTVAMIVNDRTIRLYVIPHNVPEDSAKIEAHSIDHELDDEYGCPFSDIRWVHSHANLPAPPGTGGNIKGRLIVASPGGVVGPEAEDSIQEIEGGRIIMFDFDAQYAGTPGQTFTISLGKAPPQMLEEDETDLASEVALVRRRTLTQSRSGSLSQKAPVLGRAASTISRVRQVRSAASLHENGRPNGTLHSSNPTSSSPYSNRRNNASMLSLGSDGGRSLPDVAEANDEEIMEEPFSPNAPRPSASLQRAASAATRYRIQTIEEKAAEKRPTEANFLPLPQYSEEPNTPLPGKYRALAGLEGPKSGPTSRFANGGVNSPIDAVVNGTPPPAPAADPNAPAAPQPPPGKTYPLPATTKPISERVATGPQKPAGYPPTSSPAKNGMPFGPPMAQNGMPLGPPMGQNGMSHGPPMGQNGMPLGPNTAQNGMQHGPPVASNGMQQGPSMAPNGMQHGPPMAPNGMQHATAMSQNGMHAATLAQNGMHPAASMAQNGITATTPMGQTVPRSLQRAYSNAVSPITPNVANKSPQMNGGDWEFVSPLRRAPTHPLTPLRENVNGNGVPMEATGSNTSSTSSGGPSGPAGPSAPTSMPIIPPGTATTPFQRAAEQSRMMQERMRHQNLEARSRAPENRLSKHAFAPEPVIRRSASVNTSTAAASAYPPFSSWSQDSRRPPHVMAFHTANAVSSSLLPSNPNAENRRHSMQPAGSVAHPITNWYPPAPSRSDPRLGGKYDRPSSAPPEPGFKGRRRWFSVKRGEASRRSMSSRRQSTSSRPSSIRSRSSRRTNRFAEDEPPEWMADDKKCVVM